MIKRAFLLFFSAAILMVSCHSDNEKKLDGPLKKPEISLDYDPMKSDAEIAAYFQKLHDKRGFNGNVLVAKKGKILFQHSYGWADYLYRDSLNIDSRFQLASVSKPLTATGILMLYDNGKLKLDDDIRKYLPNFPNEGITVKMLLTHRSGLNNYQYFCDDVWDRKTPIYNDDVIRLYAEHKPAPYSKPGATFFYCNTNYMLLASIIEKVSGKSYTAFMQDEIFRPLGMNNTIVYSKAKDKEVPTKVWGYDRVWRRSVVPNYLDGVVGDKGVYSTVRDLYVFDQALQKGMLLKKQTLAMAYNSYSEPKRNKHFNYGLGWRLFNGDDGKNVVYHTGWWHGFQNIFVRDVQDGITIVILSNMFNGAIAQIDDLYKMVGMPVIRKGAYNE
ncbi:MAG: beta-lactamase family protein [Mucilaginibacter polytrichastri]|nr:beta-lactamase family protein [Mucilaginibacter polytrichastri]